ncbi:hypothetical protein [Treponema sp.]|uniref:hypothetical protein n=1 Tax=Treponema sp. TaxID=166 RepID=UPI0025F7C6DA|nr:hypothetical protein [Treponema sp.]MCR5218736.1 hypothetical protein [Treponema sp.]
MKKIVSVILAALAFSFCAAAEDVPFSESKSKGNGVILRQGCVLWNKADDGKIKWVSGKSGNADAGKTFTVSSEATATLVSSSGESKGNFYGIELDGKSYYVLKSQVWVSDNAKPAIKIRGNVVCRRPLLSSFLEEPALKNLTIGAVDGETKGNFKVFHYYNTAKYLVETVYIPVDSVSDSKADLEAVELRAKLDATKDADLKAKLIDMINTSACADELKINWN